MHAALTARFELSAEALDTLLDLALAPETRTALSSDDLRTFGARFGQAEGAALVQPPPMSSTSSSLPTSTALRRPCCCWTSSPSAPPKTGSIQTKRADRCEQPTVSALTPCWSARSSNTTSGMLRATYAFSFARADRDRS